MCCFYLTKTGRNENQEERKPGHSEFLEAEARTILNVPVPPGPVSLHGSLRTALHQAAHADEVGSGRFIPLPRIHERLHWK